jgi:hypothetical protein
MKPLPFVAIIALALVGSLAAAPKGPEVVVGGDVLPTAPASIRPEPGRPVYYLLLGGAEADFGVPLGQVPPPDPKVMEAELIQALARQGFIQTKVGGPLPQIAIAFSWGTANIDDIPEEDASGGIIEMIYKKNREGIWRVIGFEKANWGKVTLVDESRMSEVVHSNRLYVFVIAFDTQELLKKKHVVLWRTRMSIDLLDGTLVDSFPTMLASAAPYFGRSTEQPVFIDDRDRTASVRLGELKVLEMDAKPATPKPDDRDPKK